MRAHVNTQLRRTFSSRDAPPTVYFEPAQLFLEIDLLAFEKVENVDHFGKLGREEEQLVVGTDAEG